MVKNARAIKLLEDIMELLECQPPKKKFAETSKQNPRFGASISDRDPFEKIGGL